MPVAAHGEHTARDLDHVGQVEAQVMIRPYLAGMTNSELLASMSGSLACITQRWH